MKRKILIVEDEPIVGLSLEHTLRAVGYETALVSSGEAAVSYALQHVPSVILMDIKLKGIIDGIQAAQTILEQKRIPLIFLTAYVDNQMAERIREVHAFGYLVKPFENEVLESMILKALAQVL
jgi:CheY-like chemotaxis protein